MVRNLTQNGQKGDKGQNGYEGHNVHEGQVWVFASLMLLFLTKPMKKQIELMDDGFI